MAKKNKAFIALLATMGLAVTAGVFALNTNVNPELSVSAATTDKITMQGGASIRLTDPTGIRYTATLDSTLLNTTGETVTFADGVTVGMLIVPYKVIENATDDYIAGILAANPNKTEEQFTTTFDAEQIQSKTEGGVTTYYVCGAITGITDDCYNSEYSAVAYYVQNGVYNYSGKGDAKTIAYVADTTLKNGKTAAGTDLTSDNKTTLGDMLEKSFALTNPQGVSGYVGDTADLSTYFADITGEKTYEVTAGTAASLDGSVVTLNEVGTVTVTVTAYEGAVSIPVTVTVKEPTKLISAKVSDNEVVTAYTGTTHENAAVSATATSFTLDMSDKTSEIVGTLKSVKVGDTTYTENILYADGKVTVNATVPVTTYGEKVYTALFENESEQIEVSGKTLFVTMFISNETDLAVYSVVGHALAPAHTCNTNVCSVNGYFAMDNDITCTTGLTLGAVNHKGTLFNATFDGRGHVIDNYKNSANWWAFTYRLGQNSALRNIAFTNLDNSTINGPLLACESWNGSGNVVENIYLQYKNYVNSGSTLLVGVGNGNNVTFNNIIVTAHTVSGDNANAVIGTVLTDKTYINNVYTYELGNTVITKTTDATGTFKAYADKAAMIAAGNSYAVFTVADFWSTDDNDGLPYPKKLEWQQTYTVKFYDEDTIVNAKRVYVANETFEVPTGLVKDGYVFEYWMLDGESTAYDFTTAGTVATQNMKFVAKWAESKVSGVVSETEMVWAIDNYGSSATITQQAQSYTIDVSDVMPSGDITALTVGATTYTDGFGYANGTITVNHAPVLSAYGLKDYSATFNNNGSIMYVTGKMLFVTMKISNYDELKSFESIGKLAYDNDTTTTNYIGYFVLDKSFSCKVEDVNSTYSATGKFQGTFDGRGYTISDLEFGSAGFFGTVCDNTVIKNFALTNTKNHGDWGTALLANGNDTNTVKVSFENIYIQMSYIIECWKAEGNYNHIIFGSHTWSSLSSNITYTNIVVVASNWSNQSACTSIATAPANNGNIQNVYVCGYTAGAINWREVNETSRGLDGDSTDKDKYAEYDAISGLNADIAAGKIAAIDFTDTGYWTYDAANGLAFVVKA